MQSTAPPPERPDQPQAPGAAEAPRRGSQRSPSRSTTTGSVRAVSEPGRRRTAPRRRTGDGPRGPSATVLLWPFGAGALAVLLAAFHGAMGSPFGAKFAAELWDTCKQFGLVLLAYGPYAGYAHRANKNALAAGDGRGYALGNGASGGRTEDGSHAGREDRDTRGEDDCDHHDDRRRRP